MERTIDTAQFIADVYDAQMIRAYRSPNYSPPIITIDIDTGYHKFSMNLEAAMAFYDQLTKALKESWETALLE